MKKLICLLAACALFGVPAGWAQKVNKKSALQKIEKSDAEIADAKKAEKAATWLSRGKIFLDAAQEPTKSIYVGMEELILQLSNMGAPTSIEEVVINNRPFGAWQYDYVTLYMSEGKIVGWKETQVIYDGAAEKAVEAYLKAYEIDPRVEAKVREGLTAVANYYTQLGNASIDIADYPTAYTAFGKAVDAQSALPGGEVNAQLLYIAGYLATVQGSTDPAAYAIAEKFLTRALEMGYNDEKGDIYYYLFHDYYGQREADPQNLFRARDILLQGIAKYPQNEQIMEGLMQLYTTEEGVGNPAELIAMFDTAIERDPQDANLWFGRARIFLALKDYDEAIRSFEQMVAINPEDFQSNFFLGYFIAVKGDAMIQEMNEKTYSSMEEYAADSKLINQTYAAAIPHLEKAHDLRSDDFDTVLLLKELTFKLRDDVEGMTDKNHYYDGLYKRMQGE